MKFKNNKSVNVTVNFNVIVVLAILFGVFLIIISSFGWGEADKDAFWSAVKEILSGVGYSLISAVAVSLILEKSTLHNNINKAINNVLNTEFPLEAYSNEKLNRLHYKIACKRSNGKISNEKLESTLYSLEQKLLDMTTGLYYEYHNETVKIYPIVSKGVFLKKVEMSYLVVNEFANDNEICIELCLDVNDKSKIKKATDLLKVTKFKINDKDLKKEVASYLSYEEIPESDSSTYQYKVIFRRKLQQCVKHHVEIEYEYESPITDLNQTYKLSVPAKKINHNIMLVQSQEVKEPLEWALLASAFTVYWDENSREKMVVKQITKTNSSISLENWVMPGSGYSVYFYKKT